MRLFRFMLLFGLMIASIGTVASAQEIQFESKPSRTRLLEMYTSEGCSSCPPAEAWLSKLIEHGRLWQDFVPIAFHVDYWDRLGWRDPYAAKAWTARQYRYSALWGSGSVYTPGFVLDGREWHNNAPPAGSTEKPGILKISLTSGDSIAATFPASDAKMQTLELHVARLGFGLTTKVTAGENSGRRLLHDFVVLSLTDGGMNAGSANLRLPHDSALTAAAGKEAIAAWVTQPGQLEPLQAVGGWIATR